MLTTRTARWSAVTGLVCVIVLVATWFVLVAPRRSEAADLADQQAAAESQNVTLQGQIRALTKQYGDLPAKRAELKEIRRQLPPAADVADLVRDVTDAADDSGVVITMLTPGAPSVLSPASGTTPGVVSIGFTIQAEGRYVEDALFIKYLQTMERRYLITEVSASKGGSGETSVTGSTSTSTTGASPTPSTSASVTTSATTSATASPTSTSAADDVFTVKIAGEVFSLVDAAGQASAAPTPGATTTPGTSPTTSPTTTP